MHLCSRVGADDRVEEERKAGTVGSNACVRVRWDGRKGGGGQEVGGLVPLDFQTVGPTANS